jgi:hypothetical protein
MGHYKKTDEVRDITRRQIRYGALQEDIPGMRHDKKTNQVWGITRRQTRCETLLEDKPGMGHYKKTDEVRADLSSCNVSHLVCLLVMADTWSVFL